MGGEEYPSVTICDGDRRATVTADRYDNGRKKQVTEPRVKVEFELPKGLFIRGQGATMIQSEVLRRLAATFYSDGTLSLGKAAELAGLAKQEFLDYLAVYNIPIVYGTDELEEDLSTIEGFQRDEGRI